MIGHWIYEGFKKYMVHFLAMHRVDIKGDINVMHLHHPDHNTMRHIAPQNSSLSKQLVLVHSDNSKIVSQ